MAIRKKALPKPAPVNISELARKHGITREAIRRFRDRGVDLSNGKALTEAISTSRASLSKPTAAPTDGAESYTEARRRRAIADADRAEIITKRESGSVIAVSDVDSLFNQIGAEMRSRLLAMRSDLVVELEGQTGPAIYRILDKRICELLERIHNNSPIPKIK